jgi:hypothetical protein
MRDTLSVKNKYISLSWQLSGLRHLANAALHSPLGLLLLFIAPAAPPYRHLVHTILTVCGAGLATSDARRVPATLASEVTLCILTVMRGREVGALLAQVASRVLARVARPPEPAPRSVQPLPQLHGTESRRWTRKGLPLLAYVAECCLRGLLWVFKPHDACGALGQMHSLLRAPLQEPILLIGDMGPPAALLVRGRAELTHHEHDVLPFLLPTAFCAHGPRKDS